MKAHVLDNIAGDSPVICWSELKVKWPGLHEVPFKSELRSCQIDVMIGRDNPVFHHVLRKASGDQPNDPIACLTNLGWMYSSPTLVEEFRYNSHSHFTPTYRSSQVYEPPPSDDLIVDKPDQRMMAEERATVSQMSETMEVRKGQYRIGIPWKEGKLKLTNNNEVPLMQLKNREKLLQQKGAQVMETYNEIFQDYKDYIRQVPKSEIEEKWFQPHFPVVKDRVGTKECVVFDAAAKHDGKSMNDATWPGTKLQRELVHVFTCFCWEPVALSADISEMILQVELQDKDFDTSKSLTCMSFSVYCLEIPLRNFVLSMSFRPMPRPMLRSFLLKTPCMIK